MTNKLKKNSNRITFWALIGVFFLPLVLAIIVYMGRDQWGLTSQTQGQLLNPPLTLSWDLSQEPRLWRVVFITPDCMDSECEMQLAKIESVHNASGKDYDRVNPLLVTTGNNVDQRLLENFASIRWIEVTHPPDLGLYIMDPDGLLILKYPADTPGGWIVDDLRHLLKVSQIG